MWQSNFIESNGIRLHYTRTGSGASAGKPVFILLHGFSDDGLCWTPIAQALESDYDIIMVDARGHGRSDGPSEGYGHDQHAADVAGLIGGLGLNKPFVMGHSMGAATTLALAAKYPDLPGAVVLEDPPPWWISPPAPALVAAQPDPRPRMGDWIIELKRKTREEMIEESRKGNPTWSEAERGPWADSKLRMSFNVLGGFSSNRDDLRPLMSHIKCPALLVISDTELGGIASADDAADLKTLVPQLQVAHIAGAGHNIRREQTARFLEAVRGFLKAQPR